MRLIIAAAVCLAATTLHAREPIELNGSFYYQWDVMPPPVPWDGFINEHTVTGITPDQEQTVWTWPLDVMPETVTWGLGPFYAVESDPLSWVHNNMTYTAKDFVPDTISLRIPHWVHNKFGGAYRVEWAIAGNGSVPEPTILAFLLPLGLIRLKR